MSTAAQIAAARINSARAGLTGPTALPENEPGAQVAKTPTEYIADLPTEFGGLTHLFGGNEIPNSTLEPVNVSLTAPGGVAGKLGGLVPDVRTGIQSGLRSVGLGGPPPGGVNPGGVEQPFPQPVGISGPVPGGLNPGGLEQPVSVFLKNWTTRIRQALKV